ncbi:bifunctional phosphoribosyl-AMP cyclohydrolase/phosphoribosyl-ATP diphosphatase HisIE [Acidaminococcus sp. LBK-2]|uniref:bifunctional phosphoribosyl-AMP cyclohydrolase/phosphoribosyl-ATP diphosphatase HisIE n=1 Tax=Acidaminococcus sp. LBK-2 TaxID=3456956 RepID=UPI003FA4B68F
MKIDISKLKFDDRGLIPAIVQDVKTDKVLMLAYMNGTSLARTVETGYTWFWSRSRQELWNKGATSGHTQKVYSITYDCDGDALLVKVEQKGAACHTGNYSCFFNPLWNSASGESLPVADNRLPQVINELYKQIVCYQEKQKETQKLLPAPSQDNLLTELGANTTRTILASKNSDADQVVYEMGDLWYHCLVLLAYHNITPGEMLVEMAGRKVEEEK